MACLKCPYTYKYELLWQDASDPALICVLLRCCAGPELQVRRGSEVLRSELLPTTSAVLARAERLRPSTSSGRAAPLVEGRPNLA